MFLGTKTSRTGSLQNVLLGPASVALCSVDNFHSAMCCHSRIIYATCGHSTFGPRPLIECRDASFDPSAPWSTGCEIVAHPYKTLRLDQLCPQCTATRDKLLKEVEEKQGVKFDAWQWKVSYSMPSGGKDYWTKKTEEKMEPPETPKTPKTPRSLKTRTTHSLSRFSWRKSKRKSVKMADVPE